MGSTRNWRNDPMTDKQRQLIVAIWEDAGMNGAIVPKFHGKTKGEASDYIDENLYASHLSAYNPHEDAGDRE